MRPSGTRTASTRPSGSRCATASPSSGSCALASSTGTPGLVEQGHRADGQFKVLRLTSDASFAAEFQADRDLIGGVGPKLVADLPQETP